MSLAVPFTQLSNILPAPVSMTKNAGDNFLSPLLNTLHKQQPVHLPPLEVVSARTQNNAIKTLMDILVKEQRPIDTTLRETLSKILTPSKPNQLITSLLQQRNLFLLKLMVNDKTQWAISANKIPLNSKLSVLIPSQSLWQINKEIPPPIDAKPIIAQAFRTSLPKAKNLSIVFQQLNTLNRQFKSDANANTLSPALKQALNTLLKSSSTPAQLKIPQQLKFALQQSGALFESKLKSTFLQLNTTKQPKTNSSTNVPTSITTNTYSLRDTGKQPLTQPNALEKILRNLFQSTRPPKNHAPINTFKQQKNDSSSQPALPNSAPKNPKGSQNPALDIKAQLLIIKQLTQLLLKQTAIPKNFEQSKFLEKDSRAPASAAMNTLPNVKASNRQSSNRASKAQQKVVQQIQQQVIAASAKIQFNQAQALQQQQNPSEGRTANTILQLEIPIRFEDHFHSLQLQVDEDWIEKESETGEKKRVKQWRVNFSLELPNAGDFYATILQCEEQTNVKLWAEHKKTAEIAQVKIEALKQQLLEKGIAVQAIQCVHGSPAHHKAHVGCALVDVTL